MIKKVLQFLKEFDFFWTVPLSFGLFLLFPYVGELIFCNDKPIVDPVTGQLVANDCSFSMYPPEFFHAGIYAGVIAVLINSFVQMGIYYNFPVLYEYYLEEGFKNLNPITKICVFLFIYTLFFVSLLFIWGVVV